MENTAEAFQWSREESCRTKPTLSYEAAHSSPPHRHRVLRRDIRVSLHSGLYFANGKVPRAPITSFRRRWRWRWRSGWRELLQQQHSRSVSPPLSLSSLLLCLPRTLFAAVVPLSILVVINTSAGSKRGEPPPLFLPPLLLVLLAAAESVTPRFDFARRRARSPPSGNSRQRSARGSTTTTTSNGRRTRPRRGNYQPRGSCANR